MTFDLSDTERRAVELVRQGKSYREAGREVGAWRDQVQRWCYKAKVKPKVSSCGALLPHGKAESTDGTWTTKRENDYLERGYSAERLKQFVTWSKGVSWGRK